MKPAVYILAAVGALCVAGALRIVIKSYLGEREDFLRTPTAELTRHPERTGIDGLQEITFGTAGGPRLAGWFAPSQNRAAVILVHGTGADRSAMLPEALILTQAGFGILALDLPGQGASQGQTQWGVPERKAISAAVDWLAARSDVDPRRIGGLGMSMGAYVLTQAAVSDKRLHAIVLASCVSDVVLQEKVLSRRWGPLSFLPANLALRVAGMPLDMQPVNVISAIAPRPILIVHGDRDDLVPPFMAEDLYDAAGDPRELWMVHGAAHANFAQVAGEAYRQHVAEFFRRTLLDQGPS